MGHLYKGIIGLAAALSVCILGGCSRDTINIQIAEAIGTTGMYENNEPVESPQMLAERLARESESELNSRIDEAVAEADLLSSSCMYQEAVEYLQGQPEEISSSAAARDAIAKYQKMEGELVSYSGPVPHLCFPTLIYDTARAFDGDDASYTYSTNMISCREFNAILESLYKAGYILVDIHDVVCEETSEDGVTTMEMQDLKLPKGKKPLILSQDNLNYADVNNGDGIATKLTFDADGEVKAVYTDESGHDLKGDYDLIPIVNTFVEEHPDFSYRGAKGIVSVSGSSGVFGYRVSSASANSENNNLDVVKSLASSLISDGWKIACAGYSHGYMNDMEEKAMISDMEQWEKEVGALVGETDILFYPYGAEVEYPGDKLTWLTDHNYLYLCGLWASEDYLEIGEGYVRQTRRFMDGYALENAGDNYADFFSISSVIDPDR